MCFKQKLKNQFTINLNDDAALLVAQLAEYYNRKPAELLRILVSPVLFAEFAKIQTIQQPNTNAPTVAKYKK